MGADTFCSLVDEPTCHETPHELQVAGGPLGFCRLPTCAETNLPGWPVCSSEGCAVTKTRSFVYLAGRTVTPHSSWFTTVAIAKLLILEPGVFFFSSRGAFVLRCGHTWNGSNMVAPCDSMAETGITLLCIRRLRPLLLTLSTL